MSPQPQRAGHGDDDGQQTDPLHGQRGFPEHREGQQDIQAHGNFDANSADAIFHAALAGLGIARLSTYLVAPELRSGRLVQLLQGECEDHADIFAVFSNRRNLSPKIRFFVDYLVGHFHPVPPWDRVPERASS